MLTSARLDYRIDDNFEATQGLTIHISRVHCLAVAPDRRGARDCDDVADPNRSRESDLRLEWRS